MSDQSLISAAAHAAENAAAAAASASDAAKTAAENASIAAHASAESAKAIAIVATDTSWMKKSLEGIIKTLDEMQKAYVTAAQHAEVIKLLDDHEKRIRIIEENMWKWIGITSVVSAILTMGISLLLKFIK